MRLRILHQTTLAVSVALTHLAAAQTVVWGSFDTTRVGNADLALNGSRSSMFRSLIQDNGGAIAPGTPTLTPQYLGDKQVFYTSYLSFTAGALSFDEQSALHDWIAAGGTLIVSPYDNRSFSAYDTFTAFYGVTGFTSQSYQGFSYEVLAEHRITEDLAGEVLLDLMPTPVTSTAGGDALKLIRPFGHNGLAYVLGPETGFTAGGRIFVIGGLRLFDNRQNFREILMRNIVRWANDAPAAETVAPSGATVTLGRVTAGNVGSLATKGDGDVLVVCKFLVPNLQSPYIQLACDGTTTVTDPEEIRFRFVLTFVQAGSYRVVFDIYNFRDGMFETLREFNADPLSVDYLCDDFSDSGRLVGNGGDLRVRFKLFQTGPSAVSYPCTSFDMVHWKVYAR